VTWKDDWQMSRGSVTSAWSVRILVVADNERGSNDRPERRKCDLLVGGGGLQVSAA